MFIEEDIHPKILRDFVIFEIITLWFVHQFII